MADTKPILIFKNGDIHCIPITITNETVDGQGTILNNVHAIVTTPAGLEFESFNSTLGSFDSATSKWTVGTLMPGQSVVANLCFTVIDDCLAPFSLNYSVFAATQGCNCETDIEDNSGCTTLNGVSCCELQKCIPEYVPGNNITMDYDAVTDTYTINGYQTTYDSVTNSLVVNNPDGTQTIQPLNTSVFVSNGDGTATHTSADGTSFTVCEVCPVLVDNGDGTYTFTNADGTVIVIGDTSVSPLVNNGDGTATYTDETGVVTVLDICQMVQDGGCLPTLVDNGDGTLTFDDGFGNTSTVSINEIDMDINSVVLNGSVITFTAEDGTTVDLDVCAIVAGNCNATLVVNPDGSVTHTDNAGTVTTIPAPIPSVLVDNGDGTITHTSGDGTITTIAVCDLIADGGCTDTLVDNGDGTYTHTSLDGTVVIIDASDTWVDNADGTYTLTDDSTGDVLTINTVTTFVSNGDGTATITNTAGDVLTVCEICPTAVDNGDGTYTITNADGTTVTVDATDTWVDNGDGTWTITDNATGVATTIGASSTLVNNGDGTFTHTGADGTATQIDVCQLVSDGGCGEGGLVLTSTTVNPDGTSTYVITHTSSDGSTQDVSITTPPLYNADIVNNNDGTFTFTDSNGDNVVLDICQAVAAGGCLPTITNNGDSSYTFDDGHGNTSIIDVNEIDLDINDVSVTGSVLTFTSEDGTTINVDVCAIVAANCNASLVQNADGSLTFTDNAGNTTIVDDFWTTVVDNSDGTWTYTYPDGTTTILNLCTIVNGIADNGNTVVTGDKVLTTDGTACEIKEIRLETVTVGANADPNPNTNGEVTDPIEGDTYVSIDNIHWVYDGDTSTWYTEDTCCETLVTAPAITDPSDPTTIDCTALNIGDTFYWAAVGTAGPTNYDYKYTVASDGAGGCVTVIDDKPVLIASVEESCECESCEGTTLVAVGNNIDGDGNLVTNVTDSDGNTITSSAVAIPCTCPDAASFTETTVTDGDGAEEKSYTDGNVTICDGGLKIVDHEGGVYVDNNCTKTIFLENDLMLTPAIDDGVTTGDQYITVSYSESDDVDITGVSTHHRRLVMVSSNSDATNNMSATIASSGGRANGSRSIVGGANDSDANGQYNGIFASGRAVTNNSYNFIASGLDEVTNGSRNSSLSGRASTVDGLNSSNIASIDSVIDGNFLTSISSGQSTMAGFNGSIQASSGSVGQGAIGRYHITASNDCTINAGTLTTNAFIAASQGAIVETGSNAAIATIDGLVDGDLSANIASNNGQINGDSSRAVNIATIDCTVVGPTAAGAPAITSAILGNFASDRCTVNGYLAVNLGCQTSEANNNHTPANAGPAVNVATQLTVNEGDMTIITSSRDTRAAGQMTTVTNSQGVDNNNENLTHTMGSGAGAASTANRTYRFSSVSGNIDHSGAITSGVVFPGLAEIFENGVGKAIPLGTLLTLSEGKVVPAKAGDDICGIVKAKTACAFLAGDTPFSSVPRFETDEWGALIMEDQEYESEVYDTDVIAKEKAKATKLNKAAVAKYEKEVAALQYEEVKVDAKDFEDEDVYIKEVVKANVKNKELAEDFAKKFRALKQPTAILVKENDFLKKVKTTIKTPRESAEFKAVKPLSVQTPRSERPDEFTIVEILGQAHTRIDDTVTAKTRFITVGKDGVGTASDEPTNVRLIRITSKGIALVLIK